MFTTALRYRTPSYGKQEIGGIFLQVMHGEALSPVLGMEKALGFPLPGAQLTSCQVETQHLQA